MKIIVNIKGRKVNTKVEGVKGPSCDSKTDWLNRMGVVVKDQETDEYYEAEAQQGNELTW